ncbi:hypothetical protein LRY65_03685 [Candidatus Woesebacteria bacterium]|nr:hypothetical protein [Candidatus Woesebacteria bacterium]MCD8506995.1 hypothetical protein [Candidatus Woesebacteria bacterium]MCD8527284.1 hypothetical protein [Candidatus Woesebacteria bacterium]MCD8546651.1 hypothetical protein [Candidatus Woesebacteria bacterium]
MSLGPEHQARIVKPDTKNAIFADFLAAFGRDDTWSGQWKSGHKLPFPVENVQLSLNHASQNALRLMCGLEHELIIPRDSSIFIWPDGDIVTMSISGVFDGEYKTFSYTFTKTGGNR